MKKRFLKIFVVLLLLFSSVPIPQLLAVDLPAEWVSSDAVAEDADETIRIIIQLESSEYLDGVKQRIAQLNGGVVRKEYDVVFNGLSAEIPRKWLPLVRFYPGVQQVTESQTYYPLMSSSALLTQSLQAAEHYANKGEGMVVSVIDSGVDTSHKDLQTLTNPERAKIKAPFEVPNRATGDATFTMKVPYGYNFADDSYAVKGTRSDHGIHVAGIIGANATDAEVAQNQGIDGVASEVQLLAMGVFSNDPNKALTANDDDIIAAIESSIEHGADIINMSLGGSNGFTADNEPMHRAVNAAQANGVLVVIAAGNDSASFTATDFADPIQNFVDRDDVGLVASPSTASGALSVASFENSHTLSHQFRYENAAGEQVFVNYKVAAGEPTDITYPLVVRGKGFPSDFADGEDLSGKAVLVERGDITFANKVKNAHAHNAAAVLIYNNVPEKLPTLDVTGAPATVLTLGLSQEDGRTLKALAEQNSQFSITFSKNMVSVPNELSGAMSTFSSWGTTNALDFKPEISGVGGTVYATINDNAYGTKSGTSMAAPHVAGASAIVLSQLKKDLPGLANYADFTKKTLMNTALILHDNNAAEKLPYSPRRQGSGLIQSMNAIQNRVLATYETGQGAAAGALRSFTGKKQFNVVLKNYGSEIVTFRVNPGKVLTTATVNNTLKQVESPAILTASQSRISLSPNEEKSITFTLDATMVTNDFVEGFIQFESRNPDKQPNIHFAYMGYAGDWNSETAFDVPDTQENTGKTVYSSTRLVSYLQTSLGIPIVFPLGVNINRLRQDKPSEQLVAFSPNADGIGDIVVPQIGILRNLGYMEFNLLNHDRQFVARLGSREGVRRLTLQAYHENILRGRQSLVPIQDQGTWDGYVYDGFLGKRVLAAEGQYYIQALGQLSENFAAQQLLLPVKLDITKPTISVKETNGAVYEQTAEGRVVHYTVDDANGINITYARVGNERYPASVQNDGSYKVVVPNSIAATEELTIIAYDYALNEATHVVGLQGGQLQFRDWSSYIDQAIPEKGRTVIGRTKNDKTQSFAFEFTNVRTGDIIKSTPRPVKNGRIIADFVLKDTQQGKYEVVAVEFDADQKEIQRTKLGSFIYDITAPQVALHQAKELSIPEQQKFPQPNNPSYVEYAVTLNPDGSATYSGVVSDNVFSPEELVLEIGPDAVSVPIAWDGSFNHTLTNPAKNTYNTVTVSQPAFNKEKNAVAVGSKGIGRSYYVTKYVAGEAAAAQPVAPAPFALNLAYSHILGRSSVAQTHDDSKAVRVRDGKYFYTITGTTNQQGSAVLVEGQQAQTEVVYDDQNKAVGTRFSREVELVEGTNNINVKVYSVAGVKQADTKVRVYFDIQNPTLVLTSPAATLLSKEKLVSVTAGEAVSDDGQVNEVTYINTTESFVTFEGTVSDNGYGYELHINGEPIVSHLEAVPGSSEHGENSREFSRRMAVSDGDIITLSLFDRMGNGQEVTYIVRQVAPPEVERVVLRTTINKQVGEVVTATDFVASNPEQYTVELVSPIDTSTPGEKKGQLRIIYDADDIETVAVTVVVQEAANQAGISQNNEVDAQQTLTLEEGQDVDAALLESTVTKWATPHQVSVVGAADVLTEEVQLAVTPIADDRDLIPAELQRYVRTSFDIRLLNANNQELSEVDKPVTVTLPVDSKQLVAIYHIHNGQVHQLPFTLSEDGSQVSFETQAFSPFILAYEPVAVPATNEPQGIPNVPRDTPLQRNPIALQTTDSATAPASAEQSVTGAVANGSQTTNKTAAQQALAPRTSQKTAKQNLPNTGEEQTWLWLVGVVLVVGGAGVLFVKRRKK